MDQSLPARQSLPVQRQAPSLGISQDPDEVRLTTYRHVLNEFRTHPEPKSLAPDGKPCHRATIGVLTRRPLTPTSITYTGPQRKIEEAMAGLITDPDEFQMTYANTQLAPLSDLVRRPIASFAESAAETTSQAGISKGSVLRMQRGEALDRIRREALTSYAVQRAREILKTDNPKAKVHNIHDETLMTRYLERSDVRVCAFEKCKNPPRRKSDYCCDSHRDKATYNKRKVHNS